MEDLKEVDGCGRIFNCSMLERCERTWLATASEDGVARIWRIEDSESGGSDVELLRSEKACEKDELLRVSWAPECVEEVAGAAVLAGGGADGIARVWRVGASSSRKICELECGDQIYGCEWVESRLATGCDKRLEVWDVATSERTSSAEYSGSVFDVQVNMERRSLVACALSDGTVAVHDYRDPSVVATLRSVEKRTTAVSWDPTGSRVAACYGSGSVEIFDTETWTSIEKFSNHAAPVYGAKWYTKDTLITWASQELALSTHSSLDEVVDVGYAAFHSELCRKSQKLVVVGGDSTHGKLGFLDLSRYHIS